MRGSWRIDAKWLFGLICLATIIAAGVLYSASKLTERDAATSIFSSILFSIAQDDDGGGEFEEYQALAVASPDEDFTIRGASLPIKGRELIGLSYDEAVDLIAGEIAEMLYTDGPESVEQFFAVASGAGSEESSAGDDEEISLGPLGLLTQDSHDTVRRIFTFSLIAVLISSVLLVFFSRRFGRLGSLGIVLAIGATPLALLWFTAKQATKNADPGGIEGALAQALSPTAADLSSTFLKLVVLGVVLVLAAVAGHIGFALWRRFRATPTPDGEGTPPDEPEQQPGYVAGEGSAASGGAELPSIGPGGVSQA